VKRLQAKILDELINQDYALYHGDCVEAAKGIPDDSIHYSIFSPPFSALYTYSNSERDMGNSANDEEFYKHFQYLIGELFRITMPGRLVSFHCMDIPAMKSRDGFIGVKDFPGDLIRAFEKVGFIYHSKVTIWKDPLVEATRTKALGLMHKQIVKDSAMCRQGLPDYLITMRKPGENKEPIAHPDGFTTFIGESEPEAPKTDPKIKDSRKNKSISMSKEDPVYSHHVWRKYASAVWMDIRQSNTLQFRSARDEKDERHIAPLQLDVIARGIELWSNRGDVVFSPFMGIGSEGYQAIKMERKFVGIELKEGYFKTAVNNLQMAAQESIDDMLS
jgi:DNA modification methylase